MTSFLNKKSSLILLILSAMIIALSISSVSAAYDQSTVNITFENGSTQIDPAEWGDELVINGSGYNKFDSGNLINSTKNGALEIWIADELTTESVSGLKYRKLPGTIPVSDGKFTYTLDTSESKILGKLEIYFTDAEAGVTTTINNLPPTDQALITFLKANTEVFVTQKANVRMGQQATFTVFVQAKNATNTAKLINLTGVRVIVTLPDRTEIVTTDANGTAEVNWTVTTKTFEISAETDLAASGNFSHLTVGTPNTVCDECGATPVNGTCTANVTCTGTYFGPLICNESTHTVAIGAINGTCPICSVAKLTNATLLICTNGHNLTNTTTAIIGSHCPLCVGIFRTNGTNYTCTANNTHQMNGTASAFDGQQCIWCLASTVEGNLTCSLKPVHTFNESGIRFGASCPTCAASHLEGNLTCDANTSHKNNVSGAIGGPCTDNMTCGGLDLIGLPVTIDFPYIGIYIDSNGTFEFTAGKGQSNVTAVWFDSPWGYVIGQTAIIFWSVEGVADFTNKTVTLFYFSKGVLQRTETVPASTIDVSTLPDSTLGNYSAIGYHVTNFTQVHDELTVVVVFPEDTEYFRSEARNTTFVDPSNTSRRTTIEVSFPAAGLKVGVQSDIEIRVKDYQGNYVQSGEINVLWDDLWSFNTDIVNGVAFFTHTYTQAGAIRNITISFPGDTQGNRASTYKNVTSVARGTGVNIVVTQDPLSPFVGQEVTIGAAVNFVALGASPKYIKFNLVENGVVLHSSEEIAIDKVTDFSGYAQYNYVYILPHTALTINAVFSGDADYSGATGTLANIVVNPAPTV